MPSDEQKLADFICTYRVLLKHYKTTHNTIGLDLEFVKICEAYLQALEEEVQDGDGNVDPSPL